MTNNAAVANQGVMNPSYTAPMEIKLDAVRRRRVSKDRRSLVKIATLILACIFILVGMRAYCAYVQHANNVLIEENNLIRAEIDSLGREISEKSNVSNIEKVAVENYGMVFPTSENVINLAEETASEESLAETIRSEAYK